MSSGIKTWSVALGEKGVGKQDRAFFLCTTRIKLHLLRGIPDCSGTGQGMGLVHNVLLK